MTNCMWILVCLLDPHKGPMEDGKNPKGNTTSCATDNKRMSA